MKKTLLLLICGLTIWISGYSQIDTISENIYQKNGYIGIGINDPGFLFQIEGNESSGIERNFIKLHNNINSSMAYTGMILQTGSDVGSSVIQDYSTQYTASPAYDFAGFLNIGNSNNGIMFHARKQGIIKFYTGFDETAGGGIERLRIDSAGNLGIAVQDPKLKLDINGGLRIGNTDSAYSGTIRWTGSDFEGYNGSDWISLSSTSTDNLWDKNVNGLYYNLGNIGIGSESNNHLLEIESNISSGIERNFIKLKNTSESNTAYTGIILESGETGGHSVIQSYGINYTASSPYDFGGFLNISNASKGINYIANSADGTHRFYIKGTGTLEEKARIDSVGNLGLGTTIPAARLQVADGDIYISDIEKGIIMKSPDGNCWRGTLDNSGQLVFSSIDCPEVESVSSIQQLKSSRNIQVYPNPSKTLININISDFKNKRLEYRIYNLSGQVQDNGKIKKDIQTINISNLTIGVYMLSIYDKKGDRIVTQKIIKE